MIPVPHYQLIEFLDWLLQNEPNLNIREADRGMLRSYALQYIRGEREVNFNKYSVLKIFQICPMISERTVFDQMRHFSGCGRCLEYIVQEHVNTTAVQLHPFLEGFSDYAKRKDIPLFLENAENNYPRRPNDPERSITPNHLLSYYLEKYGNK